MCVGASITERSNLFGVHMVSIKAFHSEKNAVPFLYESFEMVNRWELSWVGTANLNNGVCTSISGMRLSIRSEFVSC